MTGSHRGPTFLEVLTVAEEADLVVQAPVIGRLLVVQAREALLQVA